MYLPHEPCGCGRPGGRACFVVTVQAAVLSGGVHVYPVPPLSDQGGLKFAFNSRFIQTVGPPCSQPYISGNQNPPGCNVSQLQRHHFLSLAHSWEPLPLSLKVMTNFDMPLSFHEARL